MLYSILFHLLLAYLGLTQAFEWPTITFKHKNQCNVNQTYDIQMLNCEECTSSDLAVPTDSGKFSYTTILPIRLVAQRVPKTRVSGIRG